MQLCIAFSRGKSSRFSGVFCFLLSVVCLALLLFHTWGRLSALRKILWVRFLEQVGIGHSYSQWKATATECFKSAALEDHILWRKL